MITTSSRQYTKQLVKKLNSLHKKQHKSISIKIKYKNYYNLTYSIA